MNEEPSLGKAIGAAFLVGGVLGTVGHLLVMLFSFTPLYAEGLSMVFVLGTFGLIGTILFVCGIYQKLEAFGGLGAALPFCGLAAAVAGITYGVSKETGSKSKGAMAAIVELFLKIVVIGTVICCIIAVVIVATGFGAQYLVPYAPGGLVVGQVGPPWGSEAGPPFGVPGGIEVLGFVWAFLTAGVICAICQAIFSLTKASMAVFFVILFALGAILTPFGIMQIGVQFGGGGLGVLIIDAGEAITGTFSAMLAGNPVPFLAVLGLFVFLFAIGIAAGYIKLSMDKDEQPVEKLQDTEGCEAEAV